MAWPQEYRSETYCLMKDSRLGRGVSISRYTPFTISSIVLFFFPFPSRVSADCDPSSTIGVSSKIVYKGRNKRGEDRSIVFGNIYSEREKVFFKGWRFKSIDDTNCSRFEEERMENKLAYVIYSSLPRGRRSTNTRIKMRNRKVSREKEDG